MITISSATKSTNSSLHFLEVHLPPLGFWTTILLSEFTGLHQGNFIRILHSGIHSHRCDRYLSELFLASRPTPRDSTSRQQISTEVSTSSTKQKDNVSTIVRFSCSSSSRVHTVGRWYFLPSRCLRIPTGRGVRLGGQLFLEAFKLSRYCQGQIPGVHMQETGRRAPSSEQHSRNMAGNIRRPLHSWKAKHLVLGYSHCLYEVFSHPACAARLSPIWPRVPCNDQSQRCGLLPKLLDHESLCPTWELFAIWLSNFISVIILYDVHGVNFQCWLSITFQLVRSSHAGLA